MTTSTATLSAWLLDQIAYDEGFWSGEVNDLVMGGIAEHILATCAAHRRIVERCRWADGDPFAGAIEKVAREAAMATLRDLAAIYADRPGFDPRWSE